MVTQINTAITNMPRNTAIPNMPSIINSNIKTVKPPDPRDPNYQAFLQAPHFPEAHYNPNINYRIYLGEKQYYENRIYFGEKQYYGGKR